jgi:hypothetical protein
MSGVSAANLLMKIMDFDWLPFAERDVRHAVKELHRSQPILFTQQICDKILGLVEPFLEQNLQTTTNAITTTKQQQQLVLLEPELFPPGQCIHFYRDGVGVSVNVVPNTFFGEIDFNRRMLDGTYIYAKSARPVRVVLVGRMPISVPYGPSHIHYCQAFYGSQKLTRVVLPWR